MNKLILLSLVLISIVFASGCVNETNELPDYAKNTGERGTEYTMNYDKTTVWGGGKYDLYDVDCNDVNIDIELMYYFNKEMSSAPSYQMNITNLGKEADVSVFGYEKIGSEDFSSCGGVSLCRFGSQDGENINNLYCNLQPCMNIRKVSDSGEIEETGYLLLRDFIFTNIPENLPETTENEPVGSDEMVEGRCQFMIRK